MARWKRNSGRIGFVLRRKIGLWSDQTLVSGLQVRIKNLGAPFGPDSILRPDADLHQNPSIYLTRYTTHVCMTLFYELNCQQKFARLKNQICDYCNINRWFGNGSWLLNLFHKVTFSSAAGEQWRCLWRYSSKRQTFRLYLLFISGIPSKVGTMYSIQSTHTCVFVKVLSRFPTTCCEVSKQILHELQQVGCTASPEETKTVTRICAKRQISAHSPIPQFKGSASTAHFWDSLDS